MASIPAMLHAQHTPPNASVRPTNNVPQIVRTVEHERHRPGRGVEGHAGVVGIPLGPGRDDQAYRADRRESPAVELDRVQPSFSYVVEVVLQVLVDGPRAAVEEQIEVEGDRTAEGDGLRIGRCHRNAQRRVVVRLDSDSHESTVCRVEIAGRQDRSRTRCRSFALFGRGTAVCASCELGNQGGDIGVPGCDACAGPLGQRSRRGAGQPPEVVPRAAAVWMTGELVG